MRRYVVISMIALAISINAAFAQAIPSGTPVKPSPAAVSPPKERNPLINGLDASNKATLILVRYGASQSHEFIVSRQKPAWTKLSDVRGDFSVIVLPPGTHTLERTSSSLFGLGSQKSLDLEIERDTILVVSTFGAEGDPRRPRLGGFTREFIFERYDARGSLIGRSPLRHQDSGLDNYKRVDEHAQKIFLEIQNEVSRIISEHGAIKQNSNETADEYVKVLTDGGIQADMRRQSDGLCRIWLFSEKITPGDEYKVFNIFAEARMHRCSKYLVDVSGPGGDVVAGLKIGLYIRMSQWATSAGGWGGANQTPCSSTCVNIALGGSKRNGVYVVHQMRQINRCVSDFDEPASQLWRNYLAYMVPEIGHQLFQYGMNIHCEAAFQANYLFPGKSLITGRFLFGKLDY